MNISYTWHVTRLGVRDISEDRKNAVVQTYWEKTGTDELGNSGTFTGATPFEVDPSSESFIPYSDLTEVIVLGWIKAVVVGSYEEHVNARIQEQIDEKRNPDMEPALPWATESAE